MEDWRPHPGVLPKSAEGIEKKRVDFFPSAQGVWKSVDVKDLRNAWVGRFAQWHAHWLSGRVGQYRRGFALAPSWIAKIMADFSKRFWQNNWTEVQRGVSERTFWVS
jgi:hypothetical protein